MLYQKACQISSTSISCQSTSLFEIVCRSWLWLLGVWPACDCTWRSWKVPSSVQASPPWSGIFGWGKNGEIYPGTRIFGRLGDFESFLTERRNHHPRTKKIRYKYHSSYLRNTNSCTLLHNIFHCTSFPAWILVHFGNYSHLGFALGSARLRALGCQGHGQDGLKPRHLTLPRPAGHNRISWCSAAAKLFTTGVEKGMEMMRWWDDEIIGWLDDWMMFVFLFKKTVLKSIFLVFFSASMQIVRDRYKNTYCGFQSKELLRDSVPYLFLDACQCDDSLMLPLSSSQRKRWNPESSLDGLARRFRKFSSNSQCHVCLDDLRNMRTLEAYCE